MIGRCFRKGTEVFIVVYYSSCVLYEKKKHHIPFINGRKDLGTIQ